MELELIQVTYATGRDEDRRKWRARFVPLWKWLLQPDGVHGKAE